MASPNVVIADAAGLQGQQNELTLPAGALSVAQNVEITRDGVVEVARGFEDFSDNLPDFTPEQLIVIGDTAYLNLDSGLWYLDSDSGEWVRKSGEVASNGVLNNALAVLNGHLYYCSNNVIFDVDLETGSRMALVGRYAVSASTDGVGDAARINTPAAMCTDGTNLYFCDSSDQIIRKIVVATATVSTIAGTSGASGSTDAVGAAARFSGPSGICYESGALFICDSTNHTLRRLDLSTLAVTTVVGLAGSAFSTDGTGTSARLKTPRGICTDGVNFHIAEQGASTVRRVSFPGYVVTTPAGLANNAGFQDGTGSAARFTSPLAVASIDDIVFICDGGSNGMRRMTAAGVVTTSAPISSPAGIAGDGSAAFVAGGSNTVSRFYPATDDAEPFIRSTGLVAILPGVAHAESHVAGPIE